ncbi:MAG TPA: type IV toxin-antitoxin system AbiEi family antitoxin domain-containing protein [Solirubrobacterales bacterium]|nr:type IV toxin-antitoxin system AbiEi family antitoxin domain-containing protein [Solirubrobacterales bacterium]
MRRQHGVVTRGQLEALGFSRRGIEHRVARGRLHLISRGVYAVGRPDLTQHGRWMAAVLVCGDEAALSHRSAAELWGIGWEEAGRIDVTVRRKCEIRRKGLRVRSRPSLDAGGFVRRHGIPVTRPVQTLIDLATELKPLRLERAVNEADKLDLVDPETLRSALDAHQGEPGVKKLATLLDRHTFRLSDSDLEVLFRPLALAAHLPIPLTKHRVLGYEVDFWFPEHDLVVETDGLRYHRTPSQQARMARRDQTHTAAGLRVLRFTHWQIAYAPDEVTEVLRRLRAIPYAASACPSRLRNGSVPDRP